jgi:hypothetical protein
MVRLSVAAVSGTDDSSDQRSFRDLPHSGERGVLSCSVRHEADVGKLTDRASTVKLVAGYQLEAIGPASIPSRESIPTPTGSLGDDHATGRKACRCGGPGVTHIRAGTAHS